MIHAFAATFGVLLALFMFFNFWAILRAAFWIALAIGLFILINSH